MSMMGRFVQVTPDQLKQMIDDPSSVEEFLSEPQISPAAPKMTEAMQQKLASNASKVLAMTMATADPAMRERVEKALKSLGVDTEAVARGDVATLSNLLAQKAPALAARLPNQPPVSGGGAQASGKSASISLDKAWHGVHYLLCGQPEAGSDLASQAVMGGTEIGDDVGYGPARYFEAPQVAAIAKELTRQNLEAEMGARFDPNQMKQRGIYPAQFDGTDDRQWLMDAFRELRQFYLDASAASLAVLTWLE